MTAAASTDVWPARLGGETPAVALKGVTKRYAGGSGVLALDSPIRARRLLRWRFSRSVNS